MPVRGGRIPSTATGLHGRRKTIVAFTAKFDKLKLITVPQLHNPLARS